MTRGSVAVFDSPPAPHRSRLHAAPLPDPETFEARCDLAADWADALEAVGFEEEGE